jgi:hypothetical protein
MEERGDHDFLDYEPTFTSCVYALLDHEACQVKIGYTSRPVKYRHAAHERQRGRKLELLGTVAAGPDLERALHGRFRAHRVESYEWYSSEIVAELLPLLAC